MTNAVLQLSLTSLSGYLCTFFPQEIAETFQHLYRLRLLTIGLYTRNQSRALSPVLALPNPAGEAEPNLDGLPFTG